MRKSVFTVLAAVAAVGVVPPAAAETASVSVTFADLDLTSPAGVATLDSRIAAAVDRVCAKAGRRDFKATIAWEECKAATLADAMEQLAAFVPAEDLAFAAATQN